MNLSQRVSVVIPCYNAARFVSSTLRSVMAQQGDFELEIIVVDDGSTDGSAELVECEFPSVRLIRQVNAGVGAARNVGIEAATADWVAFVDADDIWMPTKLRDQFDLLIARPDAGVCYTAWHVWYTHETEPAPELMADLVKQAEGGRWAGAAGWIYTDLLCDCVVWTSTVLARRSLLLDAGCFEETLRIGEDYDLWLRISRLSPILRVARPLALYRHHGANITQRLPERNFKAEVIKRALDRWGFVGPDGASANIGKVRAGLARSWADHAGAQLQAGNAAAAQVAAIKALGQQPHLLMGWAVLAKSLAARLGVWPLRRGRAA